MIIKKKVYIKESLRISIRENEWDRNMLDMIGKVVTVSTDSNDKDRWAHVENSAFHIFKSDTIELDFLTEDSLLAQYQNCLPSSMEKIILDMKNRLNMIVSEGHRKEDTTYLMKKTEELTDRHWSILKSAVTKHINKVLENKLEHLKSIKLRDDFEDLYFNSDIQNSLFENVSEATLVDMGCKELTYERVGRDVCEKLITHLRQLSRNSLQTHKENLSI